MTHDTETYEAATRRKYIAGLRKLADLLEAHDTIPTPYDGHSGPINIFGYSLETVELLREHVGRPVDVELRENNFWMTWRLEGVTVQVSVAADQVCERVVTGTVRFGDQTREQAELILAERFQPTHAAKGGASNE